MLKTFATLGAAIALSLGLAMSCYGYEGLEVNYVDEIPDLEDYQELPAEDHGGKCPDGRPFGIISYEHKDEPYTEGAVEYYIFPDEENAKVTVFVELSPEGIVLEEEIYVRNEGKIELYTSLYAFQLAYPNGVCNPRGDQKKS